MVITKLALATILLLISRTASSEDLDRQINTKPTVKTEILRGVRAIEQCDDLASDEAWKCVKRVESLEASKLTDSRPFLLGGEIGSWLAFDERSTKVSAFTGDKVRAADDELERTLFSVTAGFKFQTAANRMRQLRIDRLQLFRALGFSASVSKLWDKYLLKYPIQAG